MSVYVNSNFKRKPGDFYKTIDKRCTYAFLEHFTPNSVIDVCAPDGSGIVDTLQSVGVMADGWDDAFDNNITAHWIVTNPPYTRPLVDDIIYRQIERVKKGSVTGVAMLLRNNFAYAKSRQPMFRDNDFYWGEIKMLFRPKWSTPEEDAARVAAGKKIHGGIHNFTWHIWTKTWGDPVAKYSEGTTPKPSSLPSSDKPHQHHITDEADA